LLLLSAIHATIRGYRDSYNLLQVPSGPTGRKLYVLELVDVRDDLVRNELAVLYTR
jgi:hypothetical protein